ncbi:hypothetical protein PF005_g18686 [Phytophthora fragariae]|uniref:Uncharacterized protein n=1 Tax=Phytophthora fragariae TaxID=53985 RepID=A0A6A3YL24_9STRA|nr:hypothetical protein PF003_g34787 [Phytophthora fragariae]KAE8932645.1 hypothetical protein PF009_g17332 [Phytophthora fragariae]KAE8995172.1 hypothetical protein PF011_g16438 [Phytophthora fragariae]KAE9091135.1 hypothetical protein PF010_g18305 [Phytophthora fragariae]KAE9120921.1 hypothetical protein PF006_g18019 [Phytophthora fragariae]
MYYIIVVVECFALNTLTPQAGQGLPVLLLTLLSLQAPRLARSPEQSNEPYAWASRVHLRRLCVGKQLCFHVEYRVAAINRDFGFVWLAPNAREVEGNLCVIQARTGYAKVQVAVSEKKCMYADADAESNATVQLHGTDAAALVSEYKAKLVPAIVEAVRDGASLRVILKPSLQLVNFGLSGV